MMEQFIHAVQHGSEGGAMPGTICTQAPAAQPALTTERLRENSAAFERERMGLWDVGPFQLRSPEAPPRTPREYVAWYTPTPRTCVNPGVPFVIGSGHNDVYAWLQRHGVPQTAIAAIWRAGQLRGLCAPRIYLTGNHTEHPEWREMGRAFAAVDAELIHTCGWCQTVHRHADDLCAVLLGISENANRWAHVSPLQSSIGAEVSQHAAPDFDHQARSLAGPPAQAHGHYLCEFCFDQMTDQVLPAAESPTGLAMAWCGCAQERDSNHPSLKAEALHSSPPARPDGI